MQCHLRWCCYVFSAFGIYHFMDRAPEHKELLDSEYYHIQEKSFGQGRYIGSPGLAMHILKAHGSRYTFFDIEETPLRHIDSYAEKLHIREKVQTMQQDSRTGIMELLPEPGENSFIHIDPYFIDQQNDKGWDYMDDSGNKQNLFHTENILNIRCIHKADRLWFNHKKSILKK